LLPRCSATGSTFNASAMLPPFQSSAMRGEA
jgi:hypothetical protein